MANSSGEGKIPSLRSFFFLDVISSKSSSGPDTEREDETHETELMQKPRASREDR